MDRTTELENRNICRLCLSQEENANFSDIFDNANLPMEILSIGSVEVFQSDGMPRKICECCRIIIGNAYKFKQICKRADTLLKMYPVTGNVPPRIEVPQDMMPYRAPEPVTVESPKKSKTKSVGTECENPNVNEIATQTDPEAEQMEMILQDDNYEEIIAPPVQFSLIAEEVEEARIPKLERRAMGAIREQQQQAESVKILNKFNPESSKVKQFKKPSNIKIERVELMKPKILNSNLQNHSSGDEMIIDTIEANADGSIQLVSCNDNFTEEYLDDNVWEKVREEQDKSDSAVVYTCNMCDRSFPLRQQLDLHKRNHTRERNHPCDSCEKAFFSKYDLAKHVLTHTKQKDYMCIVCNRAFSRSTLLYRHEKVHMDPEIPRYNCDCCERVYLNPLDYEKHIVTHTKKRPFQCNYCDKKFAFKQGLERHEILHDNNSLPYPCQYCELRFPSGARLQRHLSSDHAGTRPFPCGKCSKRFMLSHHLYRHIRTNHMKEEEATTFQCQECEEVFTEREEFFAHCIEHADYTMTCPLCKMSFETNKDATDHINLHAASDMYYCDYCNNIFMNQDDLNQHFMDQHSEELCTIGEEFELVVDDKDEKYEAPKKRKSEQEGQSDTKRMKSDDLITYDIKEIDNENYEYLDEEQSLAAFVEYEEVEQTYEPTVKPPDRPSRSFDTRKAYHKNQKDFKKPTVSESKKLPTKQTVVKMSPSKIEQLKREGKIEVRDGNMIMRQ